MASNIIDTESFEDLLPTDLYENIPAEMKAAPRWCVQRKKVPHNAVSGKAANGWDNGVAFDVAKPVAADYDGLGFYLGDGFLGIDIDDCIAEDGTVALWAAEIIRSVPNAYWEASFSGTGVHGIVRAAKPGKACRKGIEIYGGIGREDGVRYFTVSGRHIPGTSKTVGTQDITDVYAKMLRGDFVDVKESPKESPAKTEPKQSVQVEQTGTTITSKIELLMHGEIFSMNNPFEIGDRRGNTLTFQSQSEADLSLATLLAFKHKGDAEKIDEEFRASSLYRDKWESRSDYRTRTIEQAVKSFEKAQSAAPSTSTAAVEATTQADSDWRSQFRSVGKLQTGGTRMLIKDLLPEGIFMIGGLSGVGKTFFGLSLAKALTTGKPFLGQFTVPEIVPVLYLIPELSGPSFRARCERFGIPDDEKLFLCRTITEGVTLPLNDPAVIAAVQHLRPVVILDTSIRFNKSDDENSATANKVFVNDLLGLRAAGARGIGGIQHSRKDVIKMGFTLENVLRGTGDLGAMAQCVYGLRRNDVLYEEGNGPLTLEVLCLKAPDFTAPRPFAIAATVKKDNEIVSCIDTTGDFLLLEPGVETQEINGQFVRIVDEHRDYSLRQVAEALGISKRRVQSIAEKLKVRKTKAGWIFGNVKNDVSDDPNAAKDIEETTTDASNKTPS